MRSIIPLLGAIGVVLAIVTLNIFHRRDMRLAKSKMTAEEIEKLDREAETWLQSFSM